MPEHVPSRSAVDAVPDAALAELMIRYLDHDVSAKHVATLGQALKHSAANRRFFIAVCRHVRLIVENVAPELVDAQPADAQPVESDAISDDGFLGTTWQHVRGACTVLAAPIIARPVTFSFGVAAATLACLLLVMTVIYPSYRPEAAADPAVPSADDLQAPQPAVVAHLIGQEDCVWDPEGPFGAYSSAILAGDRLHLISGIAEVVFQNGARVSIRGPADFVVDSATGGRLREGRVLARVPERARGFTITTRAARIEDLGTEFGIDAARSGSCVVHVFLGTVEVRSVRDPAKLTRRLTAGQSLRVDPEGESWIEDEVQREQFARGFHRIESIEERFSSAYPGRAERGWAAPWQSYTERQGVRFSEGPRIENKSPLAPGGGGYLTQTLLGDGREAVGFLVRRYTTAGRIDLRRPHAVRFQYRLESPLSEGANRSRCVLLCDNREVGPSAKGPGNSWAIRAYAVEVGGVTAGNWQFVGGSASSGRPFRVDSGMPVVAGTTYTMSIRLWPEDRRWEAEIAGGGRVVKSTDLAGEPMRFRSPAPRRIDRAAGGVLHFGGRVREPGETLEFSVDDVDIAPVRN